MYKQFFSLKRNPFEITPDPAFLFPTTRHNEALATLYYGVRKHKGFVVLTGEVGTGKTLMVRCLLQLLKNSDVGYAYVFNSILSSLEFLQYIGSELGLSTSGKNKSDLLHALGGHLLDRHGNRLTTVLVVDEAHHLSAEVLEEVRLLTNLESNQSKLLQIVLVGQPELDEKLDSYELRQLKQRIALRAVLGGLTLVETRSYVARRLQLAGAATGAEIFPCATLDAVHRYSQGIPRLINTICENGLINAYARRENWISVETIEAVARDFRLNTVTPAPVARAPLSEEETLLQAVNTLLRAHNKLHSPSVARPQPRREPN
jgi:general secretion pathway protein A